MLGLTDQQGARIQEAKSYLPDCYSKEFSDCLKETDKSSFANCDRLLELWGSNTSDPVAVELHKTVDKMGYCPAPSSGLPKYGILVVAVVASFAAGYLMARRT